MELRLSNINISYERKQDIFMENRHLASAAMGKSLIKQRYFNEIN